MKKRTDYPVEGGDAVRIDRYVRGILTGVTQSFIEKLIRKRLILLNGKKTQASARVQSGDVVSVFNTDEIAVKKKEIQDIQCEFLVCAIRESIIFQNEHIIAINKPAGVNVHGGTCVGVSICDLLDKIMPGEQLYVVHRLDKATTGVLILARNIAIARRLSEEFRNRRVKKEYLAVTHGVPRSSSGVIDLPILRKKNRPDNGCDILPQEAKTIFTCLKSNDELSVLTLLPVTGRKHQLRIHLSQIGCPIVGDTKYGKDDTTVTTKELHLHAWKMAFTISNNDIAVEATIHEHMAVTMKEFFGISCTDELVAKM